MYLVSIFATTAANIKMSTQITLSIFDVTAISSTPFLPVIHERHVSPLSPYDACFPFSCICLSPFLAEKVEVAVLMEL